MLTPPGEIPAELLGEIVRRGGFFAESHSIKAWLARAALLRQFPEFEAHLSDALEWNQVLAAPRATRLFAASVEFNVAVLSEGRLFAMVDEAVFPIAYRAAAEIVTRRGLLGLVATHRARAFTRLGNLGHSFTIYVAFLELIETLGGRDAELYPWIAERYVEFVASQLSQVDWTRPEEVAARRPRHDPHDIVRAAFGRPGYFGHALITCGTLARISTLTPAERGDLWARAELLVERSAAPLPPSAVKVGSFAEALRLMLTIGPREAHSLTLARALSDLVAAFPEVEPAAIAAALSTAAWRLDRASSS